MAKTQRATRTKLAVGRVSADVALYKMTGVDEEEREYDKAGPGGGVLRYVQRAVAKPDAPADELPEERSSDPLAVDPEAPVSSRLTNVAEGLRGMADTAEKMSGESPEGEMRQVLVEELPGRPEEEWPEVDRDAIRRGIRQAGGSFVDLTEQLGAIDEQSKLDEMRVTAFIDATAIRRTRVLGAYYVGAEEGSTADLAYLYEALSNSRRAGVVKWTKRSAQSLGILVPLRAQKVLAVVEVEWANRMREPHPKALRVANYVEQAEMDQDVLDTFATLIDAMADSPEALDELRDDRSTLQAELLAAVDEGRVSAFRVPERPAAEPEKPLADVLAESIADVA